jgi:hypothetical protein
MRFRAAPVLLALGLLAGSPGIASHAFAAKAGPTAKAAAKGKKPATAGTRTVVLQVSGMT